MNTPRPSFLLLSGRFFFRVRNALFPLLLGAMALTTLPEQFMGHATLDCVVIAAGIALVLGGQAFRLLVIGYAYIRRGGKNREVFAGQLVTRGFYNHTRNPMYVGNYCIVMGMVLIYGSAWSCILIALLFAWIYLAITTAEEFYLRDKFGAVYDEYARRVNRFIPDFRGLRDSLTEFSYDWRRALIKEYGTVCFTFLAVLLILARKVAHVYGYEEQKAFVWMLGAACVPVLLFYGVIRFLKKKNILRAARNEETEQAAKGA